MEKEKEQEKENKKENYREKEKYKEREKDVKGLGVSTWKSVIDRADVPRALVQSSKKWCDIGISIHHTAPSKSIIIVDCKTWRHLVKHITVQFKVVCGVLSVVQ